MLLETAAVSMAGLSVYSWFIEPSWRRVFHRTLRLKGNLNRPIRVLHLSDLHFFPGATGRKRFLHRIARHPVDFILITGDFIDNNRGIDLCIEALRPLQARYGVYAVLGNHDYVHVSWRSLFHKTGTLVYDLCHEYNDVERLAVELQKLGIVVLRNERITIQTDAGTLTVAGIDDPYTRHDDIPAAFAGFKNEHPCFTLIHTPDRFRELAEYKVDMVFSGHTHGGQICIPFWGPIMTRSLAPRHMAYGLNHLNGTTYYTTRGVGSSRLSRPRFFCRPEINFFEFHFDGASDSTPLILKSTNNPVISE